MKTKLYIYMYICIYIHIYMYIHTPPFWDREEILIMTSHLWARYHISEPQPFWYWSKLYSPKMDGSLVPF